MGTVAINLPEVRVALQQAAAETAALLRSLPNATAPIDKSNWTVRDVAAHLGVDVQTNADAVLGTPRDFGVAISPRTPDRLAALNAAAVKDVVVTEPGALADLIVEAVANFLAAIEGRDGTERVATPAYGDANFLEIDAMACVVLGEVVVHGYDIARATGKPWRIQPGHAALVLYGVADMLPLYLDPAAARGVRATYDVRIRGGEAFLLTVANGEATVQRPDSAAADCHISADPVALLLVAYGRRSQWGPILQAKIAAWGRRPWLALSFRGLFANP